MVVKEIIHGFVDSTNALFAVPSTEGTPSASSSSSTAADLTDVCAPPAAKRSRLFGSYFKNHSVTTSASTSSQIAKYLELDDECDEATDSIAFWNGPKAAKEFDKLHIAAKRALCVPASSAPIERVFSQGGLIARPHRSKMTGARLSSLIFLKCNSDDI